MSRPSVTPSSRSTGGPEAGCRRSRVSRHGTIARSDTVVKTTASSVVVRSVATSAPAGITTSCSCGPESQNVMPPRAAAGGKSRTPIRSRNAR